MILAARASAFLKRFVKFESRQTLSADLSAFVCRFVCNFEGLGGKVQGTESTERGRSKARKDKKIMQTKFV